MATQQTNQTIASRTMAAFGVADGDVLDELIAPEIVNHAAPILASGQDLRLGRENFKKVAELIRAAVPDQRFDFEDVIANGDKVAVRCTWSGTQQGELMGLPATGRRFSVQHVHIFQIADGFVKAHWAVRDDLGMLRQLGAQDRPA